MSIKKNFVYSALSGLMQYLVILITLPYISRILGVSNVGLVNFVDNTINYFLLFAMMGVNVLGIREISKSRNNYKNLQSTFSSILFIHAIFTFVCLFFYLLIIFSIPKLYFYKNLFLIGLTKIFFSLFLIEWFFKGLENFQYVTIRNIVIRILYVILIFLFIKEPSDYILYFTLTISLVTFNAIVNFTYSFKFVRFSFNFIVVKKYLREFLILGLYTILTSMYTTFNVIYLGFVCDNEQVGYYTTALKFYAIVLGIFGAFTGVMLPRMSMLVDLDDKTKFKNLIYKSINLLFSFCFPLIILTVILAHPIVYIMAGSQFIGAVTPLRIIMPLLLVVGLAQIFAIQVLIPLRKDTYILRVSIVGAILGLFLNYIFVGHYGAIGSAIVLFFCECVVTLLYIYIVYKTDFLKFPIKLLFLNILYSLPYFLFYIISFNLFDNTFIILSITIIISLIYWLILQNYILKNHVVINLFKHIAKKHTP